jgi:hypothetical protein
MDICSMGISGILDTVEQADRLSDEIATERRMCRRMAPVLIDGHTFILPHVELSEEALP